MSGASLRYLDDAAHTVTGTIRIYVKKFIVHAREIYGARYLNRTPTLPKLRSVTNLYAGTCFPRCIGAVDGAKLHWKNCPASWKGQYHNANDGKKATLSAEALYDHDQYVWSWFSGLCGTNNDRTLLSLSLFFMYILSARFDLHLKMTYRIVPGWKIRWMGTSLHMALIRTGRYLSSQFTKPLQDPD